MTGAAALEVHVWYEADPADDDALRATVSRLADVMARAGADPVAGRPRLLRRPGLRQRDGQPRATWMEVWPGVPASALEGWLERLEAAARDCGASALARGGRHVEPFAQVELPRLH